MEYNYWFYTLSAIPQTLAALVALVATFVVVKFGKIDQRISEVRDSIKRFLMLAEGKLEIPDLIRKSDEELFVLLAGINKNLEKSKDNQYLGFTSEIYNKMVDEMNYQINLYRGKYSATKERIIEFLQAQQNSLDGFLKDKKLASKYLISTLFANCSVIVVSLLFLPSGSNFNFSISHVFIIAAFAVISVGLTARSVWKVARL